MSAETGVSIRAARADDLRAVLDIHRAAFGHEEEAALVAALVAGDAYVSALSIVAERAGTLVGHVLFTSAESGSQPPLPVAVLAPLAVLPGVQRTGVGSALVADGLRRAREAGFALAVVLGHPEYYPRFGFRPASAYGIEAPYPTVDAAWMVAELVPGSLERAAGVDAFDDPALWTE